MGTTLAIFMCVIGIAGFFFGTLLIFTHDEEWEVFVGAGLLFFGAILYIISHCPPDIGKAYTAVEPLSHRDYVYEEVYVPYFDNELQDTVVSRIVKYKTLKDKFVLENGTVMSADYAIANIGGMRTKNVTKRNNPYGGWAWMWDRIKIGNGV